MHPTPTTSTPTLRPGERIGGIVLNEAGDYQHHLVLLPARPEAVLTWQAAKDWAASVGGELPTPQEQSLLFAHCKDHLPEPWCWSNKEGEDASSAWGCHFGYGYQYYFHKRFEGSAVAVRRLILESFNSFGGTAAPAPAQAKTIAALRKRLERWELDHLRALSASLHQQLEIANERAEQLQSDLDSAWRNAEAWQDNAMELVKQLEASGEQVGITQAGQLVVVGQEGGAA